MVRPGKPALRFRGVFPCPRPGPGRSARADHAQTGAVAVEFACALLFVFLIFTAYVKIEEIFLAHSRLRYATFVASRVEAVHGKTNKAASKIDKDFTLSTGSGKVTMKKTLTLPKAIGTLFGTGESFTIAHEVNTFSEPSQSGDNKAY